jgi:anti-sigma factor RsiW
MRQINCEEVKDLLSAYLENELEAAKRLNIADHLEDCPVCRTELQQFTDLIRLTRQAVVSANERDSSLPLRAAAINESVRAQISVSRQQLADTAGRQSIENFLSTSTRGDSTVIAITRRRSKPVWKRLAAAATIIGATGLLAIFAIFYQAHFSGPLLIGAARGHRTCSLLEETGVGWFKDNRIGEFAERYNFTIPKLSQAGLKLDGLHPCKVYNTAFIHLIYFKEKRSVSIYYGSNAAIDRLRETEGEPVPGKLYNIEKDTLKISAFATPEKKLWIVAGELSTSEMNEIAAELPIYSGSGEQRSVLVPSKLNEQIKIQIAHIKYVRSIDQ